MHETDRTRYILPKIGRGNYNTLVKLISNSFTFGTSDAARFRLHVLDHYYAHGIKSTCHAFSLPKSTVYDWRKTFEASKRRPSSLVPKSTKPIHTRFMVTNPKLVEFIQSLREEYGNLSKYKIKPFLDEYARENGLPLYGTTKIGKIIKRKHFFFDTTVKKKRKKKPLTPRLKQAPKEKIPGYLEMDTVTIFSWGRKYYFVTVIDVVTKFALVKMVPSPSSKQTLLALADFQKQYPYPLRVIQTDNGSEFLGEFDQYLQKANIAHHFIYLKSPKINGVVERFNRTIQEEFIQRYDYLIPEEKITFEEKLNHYLIWYNTKRPHYALGQISPVAYMSQFG